MNIIKFTLAALITVTLASCTPPAETPAKKDGEKAAKESTDTSPVDKVRNDFMTAFNAADAAKVAANYADDAVMMPPRQPVITGRAGIEDYNKKFFETYTAKIDITPVETKVFGDRALDRGSYTIELTPKAGGAAVKDEGKYLILLQRQADGIWRVTHDIDNTNIPATPPAPAAPADKKTEGAKKK